VVLLDDGKVFSHHASDPLADEHAHDAFDVYRILEHGGDMRAAIQEAAKELGIELKYWQSGGAQQSKDPQDPLFDIGKAVLSFSDLLKAEIPERKRLLPWLPEGGLSMVYSPRGLGKTFFGLSLAHALTSGTPFMNWQDVSCVGVLYIDGEMALAQLRQLCNKVK
jgi:RecA-family ATPase